MRLGLVLAAAVVASAMALAGPLQAQTVSSTSHSLAGAEAIAIANGGGGSSGSTFPHQAPSIGGGSYGSANSCGEWIGAGFSMPMGGLNFNSGSTNRRCQEIQTASQLNAMAKEFGDPRYRVAAQMTLCNDPAMRGICENANLIGRPGGQVAAQPAAYYGHAQAAYAQPAAHSAPSAEPSYQAAGYGHTYAAREPMMHAYVEASVPANAVRPPWCATVSGQAFKYPECR